MKSFITVIFLISIQFLSFGEGKDTVIKCLNQVPEFHIFQKNKTGWEVSGNFGVYKANKHQAQFYNGASQNANNLEYIFNNYYWRQEIINQFVIHAQRDSFQISQIPTNIKYDMSMYVGFSARYHFSGSLALNFSVNFAKLKTRDVVVFEVFPAYSGMVESFVNCGIYGIEARTNIDAGLLYTFNPEKQITGFAEMGLNLNSIKVKKNFMQIFDNEYNLVNIYANNSYIPNTQLNEYEVNQGGIGFGTYSSLGIRYTMSELFAMELAGIAYLKTANLEGYNKLFGLHGGLMFRLVFSPNFSFGEPEDTIEY